MRDLYRKFRSSNGQKIIFWVNVIVLPVIGFLAVFTLLDEYGIRKPGELLLDDAANRVALMLKVLIAIFLARIILIPIVAVNPLKELRRYFIGVMLGLLIIVIGLTTDRGISIAWAGLTILLRLYIIVTALVFVLAWPINRLKFRPPLMLMASFAFIMAVGACLLLLPRATVPGSSISVTDAIFTSASATCVTGLIVQDTGTFFTGFGQTVILLLIQIGGLGLMTFVAFFTLFLGKTMRVSQELLMKDVLNFDALGKIPGVIMFILASTLILEIIGAALLFFFSNGPATGEFPDTASHIYYCVFHSISAFCNAGFSLNASSFIHERGSWPVNMVLIGLIVIGGLGFAVNHNLLEARKLIWKTRKKTEKFKIFRLTIQTKMVLLVSVILIVAGFGLNLMLEWNHAFKDFGTSEKCTAALFHSITPRTAGFNTVEISKLTHTTQCVTIMLMFIGAAPGSTGGGVKVSTFFMFFLLALTLIRGRENVEAFKRTIPRKIVENALLILVSMASLILLCVLILTVTEHGNHDFLELLFETVSAFGTVGLSTGVTPDLSTAGRYIIVLAMFIGRIGPLTFVLAMARPTSPKRYEYPSETVMIG